MNGVLDYEQCNWLPRTAVKLDNSSLNFLILFGNLRPVLVCGWHQQRQVCTNKLQCCLSNPFSLVSEARISTDSSVGYHGEHLYILCLEM